MGPFFAGTLLCRRRSSIWSPSAPPIRRVRSTSGGKPSPVSRKAVGRPIRAPRAGGVGPAKTHPPIRLQARSVTGGQRDMTFPWARRRFLLPLKMRLPSSAATQSLSCSRPFRLPPGWQSLNANYRDTVNKVNVPGVSRGLTPAMMGVSLSAATV